MCKIALALEAYRAERGEYPKSLDALTPKYFKSVPLDLYSINALNYSTDGKSFRLYSVGPNNTDDSGGGDDMSIAIPRDDVNFSLQSPVLPKEPSKKSNLQITLGVIAGVLCMLAIGIVTLVIRRRNSRAALP